MRDPRVRIDAAAFHERDDPTEIVRPGVAAREQREFTPVEIGIVETHVSVEQSDKDQASDAAVGEAGASAGIATAGAQAATEDGSSPPETGAGTTAVLLTGRNIAATAFARLLTEGP